MFVSIASRLNLRYTTQAMPEPEQQDNDVARIEIDRELCIGAAPCVTLLPEVFELDAENKAIAKPAPNAKSEEILNAAKSCPVLAIYLYNKAGKRIYPE